MTKDNIALDLELFDNDLNGYVPEELPKKKAKPVKLLEKSYKSTWDILLSPEFRKKLAVRACAFAFATLLIAGTLIYFRVIVTEEQIKLENAQKELAAARSEYITLNLEMEEMLSPDKVIPYAQDKLNMSQYECHQIKYFDISGSDGILLTQKTGNNVS